MRLHSPCCVASGQAAMGACALRQQRRGSVGRSVKDETVVVIIIQGKAEMSEF